MLSRILFLLLLAANIGMAAWLWLAPTPGQQLPAVEPGVAPLVLLAEKDPASASSLAAEMAVAPESVDRDPDRSCVSLGPFPTQSDLRRAMAALTPLVERIQFRERLVVQSRGFNVFLPAPATREESLSVARQLSARGVRDYYVVTAGRQQNTISLGLFRERANAERRRSEIAALGFAPAIAERTEQSPVYWIDYAQRPGAAIQWRRHIPDLPELELGETACNAVP
jgi:hypothetical protein